ncbi:MAG: histidinol dehydrogenase [Chlorobi bacterium]|nr:histidinol dehydrogenase [Chlorobiota bacterium]
MNTIKYPSKDEWPELLKRPENDVTELFDTAKTVLDDIKKNGDRAVKRFTKMFDGIEVEELKVSRQEIEDAAAAVPEELKQAILKAKQNIEKFHSIQKENERVLETMPGVVCRQKSVPVEKVGLYIPGGSAPLFSTVLMLAVPAKIAGCPEIILCTPPAADGSINPAILYTADLVGVTGIYKAGGIQAIGAMAYGTESVPKVYKIFGPGNQFVTAAKQLVSLKDVAIDMPAGPSEVLVMADDSAVPEFVAADLLSQAEHGPDSQVILVTNSEQLIEKVKNEVQLQLESLPRKEIAAKALDNSRLILLESVEEMTELTNLYAPEHLIISMNNDEEVAEQIVNAGSVFLGNYTPESAGDYASGTNHTLPTNGYATAYSGVNLDSFVKKITYQKITKEGLRQIGGVIETMAAAEHLNAHKNAVTVRLK